MMGEQLQLKEVAVIGGGIMGAGIAAFFANNNIPSKVFDVKLELAQGAIEKLADPKARIPLLYSTDYARRIRAFSVDDYASELGSADMIVEVVPEIMGLKQKVFKQIDLFRKPGSIVATNTSGLSVNEMVKDCSDDLKAHFVGTHYFNPVRFLPLVELIPTLQAPPELMEALRAWFVEAGKNPIIGKDTPNFVGNRVGIYFMMKTIELMMKHGLSIEEVDMVTGPPLGHPKTATFRLADMVGNDTLVHASMNSYENCPHDESRHSFKPPEFLMKMMKDGLLGDKTKKGFYQKVKLPSGKRGGSLVINLETLEYRPAQETKSDCVRVAKNFVSPVDRILSMITYGDDDKYCRFSRELILGSAAYALNRVGEIADDVATIDNAMKWGFANEVGPIEILDHIGLDRAARWMENLRIPLPRLLTEVMDKAGRFYEPQRDGTTHYFDVATKAFKAMPTAAGAINLKTLKESGKIVRENLNARLIDLGDQVLCCELDAKMVPAMNPIDDHVISMLWQAIEVISKGSFKALVISNQASNFSAGAQLQMILELSRAKKWKDIEDVSRQLQMANLSLYHAPFPVVTAPHGMTLGGGLEVTFAGQKRVPYTELYCGLVEVGVGLIPAGGGCLGLLMQFARTLGSKAPLPASQMFAPPDGTVGPMQLVTKSFELIGFAKVSNSAANAIDLGLLASDNTVFATNKESQIGLAKKVALEMLDNFKPIAKKDLILPGKGGYYVMEDSINSFQLSGTISAHSAKIAKIHAQVLTGGDKASPITPVSEDYVLELERDAFVRLCAEPMSQERMAAMLKTGKPLIN